MTRKYVPPASIVHEQMKRVRALGRRLEQLADAVDESFHDVHEGGHWSGSGGSITQMHRANGAENDTTFAAVNSGGKTALRDKAMSIAALIRRELEPALSRIDDELAQAYPRALDRDLRKQLDAAEATAREYDRRHRHKA